MYKFNSPSSTTMLGMRLNGGVWGVEKGCVEELEVGWLEECSRGGRGMLEGCPAHLRLRAATARL